MAIEELRPVIDSTHKYAVALCFDGGRRVSPIVTCPTLEELRKSYFILCDNAVLRGLTKPVPVEVVEGDCKTGKMRYLIEMIEEYQQARDPRRN